MSKTDSTSILRLTGQGPIFMVGLGHGATHWIAGTFYVLLPYMSRDLGLTYAEAGIFVSVLHVSSVIANFGSGLAVDLTGRRVLFQGLSLVIGALALFAFGFTKAYLVLCAMIAYFAHHTQMSEQLSSVSSRTIARGMATTRS